MTVEEYLQGFAQQLVHELKPILSIKEVTQNTDLLGSYAESAIRRLIGRVVHPMRVSTGAVIDYPMPPQLRQIDAIVWSPLTWMRSWRSFTKAAPDLAAAPHPNVSDNRHPGLGIVCVLAGAPSARLDALIRAEKVIAVFEKAAKTSAEAAVRGKDVLKLLNFLHYVGWRHRMQGSQSTYVQLVTS